MENITNIMELIVLSLLALFLICAIIISIILLYISEKKQKEIDIATEEAIEELIKYHQTKENLQEVNRNVPKEIFKN